MPLKITCFQTSIWDETLYKVTRKKFKKNSEQHKHIHVEPIYHTRILLFVQLASNAYVGCCVQAWSSIVHALIPNVRLLERHLERFCEICEADEVVLFEVTKKIWKKIEKLTFSCSVLLFLLFHMLLLNHIVSINHRNKIPNFFKKNFSGDVHRFEKISNIIKQFKLSCSKSQVNKQQMYFLLLLLLGSISKFICSKFSICCFYWRIDWKHLFNGCNEWSWNWYERFWRPKKFHFCAGLEAAATQLNITVARSHFEELFAAEGAPQ